MSKDVKNLIQFVEKTAISKASKRSIKRRILYLALKGHKVEEIAKQIGFYH